MEHVTPAEAYGLALMLWLAALCLGTLIYFGALGARLAWHNWRAKTARTVRARNRHRYAARRIARHI